MTDQDKPRFLAASVAMFKAFGKPEDKDIVKILFLALQHLTIEDAEFCISSAMMNEPKFPTPVALKTYQRLIPPRPVKQVECKTITKFENQGEMANKLIDGIQTGKLTRRQFVEGMMHMDALFPGLGWRKEAMDTMSMYRERGYGLDPTEQAM